MQHDSPMPGPGDRYRAVSKYVFFGFLLIAAYFLIAEHRAHLVPLLPFLFLAACPLMHLFHHHGHDHGGGDSPPDPKRTPSSGDDAHQH